MSKIIMYRQTVVLSRSWFRHTSYSHTHTHFKMLTVFFDPKSSKEAIFCLDPLLRIPCLLFPLSFSLSPPFYLSLFFSLSLPLHISLYPLDFIVQFSMKNQMPPTWDWEPLQELSVRVSNEYEINCTIYTIMEWYISCTISYDVHIFSEKCCRCIWSILYCRIIMNP